MSTIATEIERTLGLFAIPGSIIEIRALNCHDGNQDFTHTRSGYFDLEHLVEARAAAIELDSRWNPSGVYITINPVMSAVHGRAANRIRKALKNESTKDVEIVRRLRFYVDCDPKRPAGISASESELQAAHDLARGCEVWLRDNGFPLPILAMSGNGVHLVYSIDLPVDDGGLIERCLQALDQRFSTAGVKIDTTVFNPSRITKLYGTMTRKGDSTSERPNRRSSLIEVPEDIQTVPQSRLQWLADQYVPPVKAANGHAAGSQHSDGGVVDVESYLSRNGVHVIKRDVTDDGAARWYITCPGESEHTSKNADTDCCVTQEHSGRLGGKCFHDSCGCRNWEGLKSRIGPITSDDFPKSGQSRNGNKSATPENTRRHNPPKHSEKTGSVNCRHYMSFPTEVFPRPVREFIEATATAMDCDEAYVGLPALAVLASSIGNTRKIRLKQSWFEPAIVWAAIIGNSGTRKSPPIDAATKPLRDRQARELKQHEERMREHEGHILHYNTLAKKYKGEGDLPNRPEEPIAERLLVSDLTIEALAPILKNQPRGVLVSRDELDGWLGGFDQYKSGKGSDLANWLELHGGRSLTVDRRTGNIRTIYVPHAAASVAGGIQPGILTSKITSAHKASGLLARLLTAYPPARVRKWTEADVEPRINEDYAYLINGLLAIPFETTPEGESVPGVVYLTPEAKTRFAEFVNEHGQEIADLDDDLTASFSKLEGYAARFALILHLSRWTAGEPVEHNQCDMVSIEAGITLSRWFANEARRVHSLLSETTTETDDRKLIELIQRHGGTIFSRDLCRASRKYPTTEDADRALQGLVNQKAGEWIDKPCTDVGGRPSRFFSLLGVDSRHNPQNTEENRGSVGAASPIQASDEPDIDFDEVAQLFGGRPA